MMDMYEKIGEIAAGFENDMVDFARRLIQTKSISGTEGGVAKLYQDFLEHPLSHKSHMILHTDHNAWSMHEEP